MVKKKRWAGSSFRNRKGNQNYDVEVQNHRLDYLEITTSSFDHGEVFRMEELMRKGWVSAIAPVERNNKGRPIRLKDGEIWRKKETVISERLALMAGRILKKSKKNYPQRTGLLVYFDDESVEIDEDDDALFYGLIETTREVWSSKFDEIFLTGSSAKKCFNSRKLNKTLTIKRPGNFLDSGI